MGLVPSDPTADPLQCTRVDVQVAIEEKIAQTTIRCSYVCKTALTVDVFIPVSEFGRVDDYEVLLDGKPIPGTVCRWDLGDGRREWLPPSDSRYNVASGKSESPDGKRIPVLYSFIARDVAIAARPGKATRTANIAVQLTVKVTSAVVADSDGLLCYALPSTCCPRVPSALSFKVRNTETIRAISTPNKRQRIHPMIRGKRAEVHVDTEAGRESFMAEYLLILQIEIGAPIRPECADPVALLILATAMGAMLFFSLTHNLEEDF